MLEQIKIYYQKRAKQLVENLCARHFEAYYCPTKEEACEKAWTKGLAEGEALARLKDAQNFKALGVSTDIIMKATGLSLEEINNL